MHQQRKRECAAFSCRVCAATCAVEQCDGCKCWLHQECVGMTTSQYVNFSQPHLQFFCWQCVSNRDSYNFLACLSLIAECAPDVSRMRARAESELNLLHFYDLELPDVVRISPDNLVTHTQSVELLRDYSPWPLDQFVPEMLLLTVTVYFVQ